MRYGVLPRGLGGDKRHLREVKLSIELPELIEQQPRRESSNGPVFEELFILARMTTWGADLGALSS